TREPVSWSSRKAPPHRRMTSRLREADRQLQQRQRGCQSASPLSFMAFPCLTDPPMSAADQLRLHLQGNAKPARHILLDIASQCHYLGTPRASEIDQHQGLLAVHADAAATMSFPASLLDQPAGSQFDTAIILRVMRHAWPGCQQRRGTFDPDQGDL